MSASPPGKRCQRSLPHPAGPWPGVAEGKIRTRPDCPRWLGPVAWMRPTWSGTRPGQCRIRAGQEQPADSVPGTRSNSARTATSPGAPAPASILESCSGTTSVLPPGERQCPVAEAAGTADCVMARGHHSTASSAVAGDELLPKQSRRRHEARAWSAIRPATAPVACCSRTPVLPRSFPLARTVASGCRARASMRNSLAGEHTDHIRSDFQQQWEDLRRQQLVAGGGRPARRVRSIDAS